MLENFDYTLVPGQFAHCFHGNCQRAGECLRYQITTFLSGDLCRVMTVNPLYTPADEGCSYFKSCIPLVYVEGMSRMFADLPYEKANVIKQKMLAHFGKTYFYRLKRKERCFTPEDQMFVKRIFQNVGIEEQPKYDAYIERFDW